MSALVLVVLVVLVVVLVLAPSLAAELLVGRQ
jgi:hypothetical protein